MTIANPTDWANAFIADLAKAENRPAPSGQANQQAVTDVVAWELAEGGNWHNSAAYNPLNTSLQEPGSQNFQGGSGSGVQAYESWQQGLDASVSTLLGPQPYYSEVASDILTGASGGQFASDLGQSPWDAGHYQESGGAPGSSVADLLGTPYNASGSGAGGTTNATLTASTTSTQKISKLSGIAGALQDLDGFLNPHNSFLETVESLGTSAVKDLVLLVVDRAILSIFFIGITGVGIYLLIKQPASAALGIVRPIQSQQRIGIEQQRVATASQAEARRQATAGL